MALPTDRPGPLLRHALPYFVKAWGHYNGETRLKDSLPLGWEGESQWVRLLDEKIRSDVDPNLPVQRLYTLVIKVLLEVTSPLDESDPGGLTGGSPGGNRDPENDPGRNGNREGKSGSHAPSPLGQGNDVRRSLRSPGSPNGESSELEVPRPSTRRIIRKHLRNSPSGTT